MTDVVPPSVFLSRRFEEGFSKSRQVNQNVKRLAKALKAVCGKEGIDLVDLQDGRATIESPQVRSIAAVASCDLLVAFLGDSFSGIVRDEVLTALDNKKGVLAFRLPDSDPISGRRLEVEEAQRDFLGSLNGLDRAVIGRLPSDIYGEWVEDEPFEYAREVIVPEILRALAVTPTGAVTVWGLLEESAGRCTVVEPANGVVRASPIDSDGLVDAARSRDLVRCLDITPVSPGAVLPSGEIVHGTSCALVLHRPMRDGYASTEIPMDEPGAVVGVWAQMQQVVVAWASASGTRLVRLSRSRGGVLTVVQIAGHELQRVVGFGAGWIGLTGDGELMPGPGTPPWVGRIGIEVAGRWADVSVGGVGGVHVVLGLVQDSENQAAPELVAASFRPQGTLEVCSVPCDRIAQRVFPGAASDSESGEMRIHVLRSDGSWRIVRLSIGGQTGSPHLTWREVQSAL